MNHNYKGEAALTFDENKKRLRLEGRIILDRMMNEVLRTMAEEFNEALLRGEVLVVGSTREEARAYFTDAALLQLEAGG